MEKKNFHRAVIDPMDPMQPTYYGTFERSVELGGRTRRFLYYVPDGAMASTAGVMLLPPSGVSAEAFLENSSWKQLCETEECKEKFILCVLESGPEGWNDDEAYGDPMGDAAYIGAVQQAFTRRDLFCVHESKYDLVGYDAGAAAAQRAALTDPARYAGLACVGSTPVPAEFRAQASAAPCVNLDGFDDPEGRLGLRKGDIPLPIWMIATDAAGDADCWADLRDWCARNAAVLRPGKVARDTIAFVREAEPDYPADQDREAYRVWSSLIPGAREDFGESVNRRIWKDFLSRVRRWMGEPGGSLRMTEDPVRDLGCEYHYELVGGWMREWYVYVPRKVRENPLKPAPVVFACHGYSCTGEIYLGNAGWNRIADRYGFIVVAPTAVYDKLTLPGEPENTELPAWNLSGKKDRPDEIVFFRHMLDELRVRCAVDDERIYATGHSLGSLMAQYLGMALPEVFTAIAPCSGVLFDGLREVVLQNPNLVKTPRSEMPVWMFVGEREEWLIPHLPEGENAPARTIRLWWKRNSMPGPAPETFAEGWRTVGRWHDLTYRKDCHAMIRYTWVADLPHATGPEMSERIWCEFFSKIRKETKTGLIRWAD